MFTVNLYTNLSATNVVSKNLESVLELEGELRAGASIIDPVIIVEGPKDSTFPTQVNYARIQEFGRYYYITNIVAAIGASAGKQLWELHMHVDVLMSYESEIKAQTAIVARQEETYNLLLDDGIFMTYQNPYIQTKLFSNATPFETQEFVLVVAGS